MAKKKEPVAWITMNGRHVPLYEGESKADAISRATKESVKKQQENIKKNEDQKEKDIGRNNVEKDKLNGEKKTNYDTIDTLREKFAGKSAADVQADKARIFKEMGSPMNGDPRRAEFEKATAAHGQLIGETINNGTGSSSGDYSTLLKTSRVRGLDNKDSGSSTHDFQKAIREAKTKEELSKIIKDAGNAGLSKEAMNKVMGSAYDRAQEFRNATAGKASDEARVKKETVSDYDKEFGTVGKVDINNAPSAQLNKRLEQLSRGDEPVGSFWHGNAELNGIYNQLEDAEKTGDFKMSKASRDVMHRYYRYYNDGDLPGWARGQFNEFNQWNKKWNRIELSPRGEMELERQANRAVVVEYNRYQKFINTVPKSFAANYPNLSSTELKKKYQEFLKKNRK